MQTKIRFSRYFTMLLAAATLLISGTHLSYAGDEGGLIDNMVKLQYFTQKTGLAIHADNIKLAAFYTHELEEVIEALEDFGHYKKMPIGNMTKTILVKPFKVLENAINAGEQKPAINAFNNLLNNCNQCHAATKHELIKIEFNNNNPFMQSFAK